MVRFERKKSENFFLSRAYIFFCTFSQEMSRNIINLSEKGHTLFSLSVCLVLWCVCRRAWMCDVRKICDIFHKMCQKRFFLLLHWHTHTRAKTQHCTRRNICVCFLRMYNFSFLSYLKKHYLSSETRAEKSVVEDVRIGAFLCVLVHSFARLLLQRSGACRKRDPPTETHIFWYALWKSFYSQFVFYFVLCKIYNIYFIYNANHTTFAHTS